MKNLDYFLLSVAITGLLACSDSSKKPVDQEKIAAIRGDTLAAYKNGDAGFIKVAATGSMMEIELGKLAQANSSNIRVKNFGAMMVKDHEQLSSRLKTLATSKDIDFPKGLESKHQKQVKHLQDRKGEGFDLSYMRLMVKEHRDNVKRFRRIANEGADSEIKAFASETLPVLQKHLDSAKAIHNVLKPAVDNVILP